MKSFVKLIVTVAFVLSAGIAASAADVNVTVNGKPAGSKYKPVIINNITYVCASAVAEDFSLSWKIYSSPHSVTVSNLRKSVCFTPEEMYAVSADLSGESSSDFTYVALSAPCKDSNGEVMVPLRNFAEIFGFHISYDDAAKTVNISRYSDDITFGNIEGKSSYYYQSQSEFALPNSGSGYCWVCSYAMLLTNIKGRVITPRDVAIVNETKSTSGANCYHSAIASAFDAKFVNALSDDSPYYGGRDSISGGTYVNNPNKDNAVAMAAIREALIMHPKGVMVRYNCFPHTMLAVGYTNDTIIFNDPASPTMQEVPFEQTCVGKKGFLLSDLTFIQAME